jgi:hypothetical protein
MRRNAKRVGPTSPPDPGQLPPAHLKPIPTAPLFAALATTRSTPCFTCALAPSYGDRQPFLTSSVLGGLGERQAS